MKYAFRCAKCGRLEPAANAGENRFPHACSVCGAGVSFTPNGVKMLDAGAWEVLAEASEARLAELGITREDVESHVPLTKAAGREADAERLAATLAAIDARRKAWATNGRALTVEHGKLCQQLDAINARILAASDLDYEALVYERDALERQLDAVEVQEHTPRDDEHEVHIRAEVAKREAGQGAAGRGVLVGAREGMGTKSRGKGRIS